MDDFSQAVLVHTVLGEPVTRPAFRRPNEHQRRLLDRLHERAALVGHSVVHRAQPYPEATSGLDLRLDEHILKPNELATHRRTVALERWLADHGFRGGNPIRFVRAHRTLHHHGSTFELPTARPVLRSDFDSADALLARPILDAVTARTTPLAGPARVSVVPGFILLELSRPDFGTQFGLSDHADPLYGLTAFGSTSAGPILVTTRDVAGTMLAHALHAELTHELAAMGNYQHHHALPSPHQVLLTPKPLHLMSDVHRDCKNIDQTAKQLVADRIRHLPESCRVGNQLTMSDFGFSVHDWIPLATVPQLSDGMVALAANYLGSFMLARTVVNWLNEHPERLSSVRSAHRLSELQDCTKVEHLHQHCADQYYNFVDAVANQGAHAKFLDGIYRRVVDPAEFAHELHTAHPVRLHVYGGPFHPTLV